MEAGIARFGDIEYIDQALEELRQGSERGRFLAQGAARVGACHAIRRVPVIKKQAISAYDPRVAEVTGVSMMTTAQGADHTAGNVPMVDCHSLTVPELVAASFKSQLSAAIADSLGLCNFGRAVTDTHLDLIASAINACQGTGIDASFLQAIGRETLRLESAFNRAAGFSQDDDQLPAFFYDEPLPPSNQVSRLLAGAVGECMRELSAADINPH